MINRAWWAMVETTSQRELTDMRAAGYSLAFEPHKPGARTGHVMVDGPDLGREGPYPMNADQLLGFIGGWRAARKATIAPPAGGL